MLKLELDTSHPPITAKEMMNFAAFIVTLVIVRRLLRSRKPDSVRSTLESLEPTEQPNGA